MARDAGFAIDLFAARISEAEPTDGREFRLRGTRRANHSFVRM